MNQPHAVQLLWWSALRAVGLEHCCKPALTDASRQEAVWVEDSGTVTWWHLAPWQRMIVRNNCLTIIFQNSSCCLSSGYATCLLFLCFLTLNFFFKKILNIFHLKKKKGSYGFIGMSIKLEGKSGIVNAQEQSWETVKYCIMTKVQHTSAPNFNPCTSAQKI